MAENKDIVSVTPLYPAAINHHQVEGTKFSWRIHSDYPDGKKLTVLAFSQRPAENTDYFPGYIALDEDNGRYGRVVIPELLTPSVTMTDFVHNAGMSRIQTTMKIVSEGLVFRKMITRSCLVCSAL